MKGILQTCAPTKFLLTSMGGEVEGIAYADLVARTPIGVSGSFSYSFDLLTNQIILGTEYLFPLLSYEDYN